MSKQLIEYPVLQVLKDDALPRGHGKGQPLHRAAGQPLHQQDRRPLLPALLAVELAADHAVVGVDDGQGHGLVFQHFGDAPVGKQGGPVADAGQLLVVKPQVQKGDPLLGAAPEDLVEPGQLRIADEGAHVPEGDQAAARHDRLHQLHEEALEVGQVPHIGVGRNARVQTVQYGLELLAQEPGPDQPGPEGGAQHLFPHPSTS